MSFRTVKESVNFVSIKHLTHLLIFYIVLNFLAIALFQVASIFSSAPQESSANVGAAIGSGGWGGDIAAV